MDASRPHLLAHHFRDAEKRVWVESESFTPQAPPPLLTTPIRHGGSAGLRGFVKKIQRFEEESGHFRGKKVMLIKEGSLTKKEKKEKRNFSS